MDGRNGLVALLALAPVSAWGNVDAIGHNDPVIPILLALLVITVVALLGREAAQRINQPSVLGELIIGILLGNVGYWLGSDWVAVLRESTSIFNATTIAVEQGITLEEALRQLISPQQAAQLLPILSSSQGAEMFDVIQVVDIFSRIGLLFLLFIVGLESSILELKAAIRPGIRVAAIGIIAPFLLGYGVMALLAPEAAWSSALMVAIALCATSIGITAHVFHEMGIENSRTAHIVLNAAVIDDILGLILMAVGIDIILSGSLDASTLIYAVLSSTLFIFGIYLLVPRLIEFAILLFHRFALWEAELFISVLLLCLLSWLSHLVGLSAIVGAFAAGLILSNQEFTYWKEHCQELGGVCNLDEQVKDQIRPFEAILAPIFFVLMGTQVKLETFQQQEIILLAAALTVVAVIGKLISGLGVNRSHPRLAIGAGMVPRGEVALILASVGKTLGVLDSTLFAAVVMMAIATTLIGPPILKWQLSHHSPLK